MQNRNKSLLAVVVLLVFCVCLTQYQIEKQKAKEGANRKAFEICPNRVMGTSCQLAVITETPEQEDTAMKDLEETRQLLASLESVFSKYISASEVSRINNAAADTFVPLSENVIEVLRASESLYGKTEKSMDITCSPIIDLWKQAGKKDQIPSQREIDATRMLSNWSLLTLTRQADVEGIKKQKDTVQVDLGALAKGYCIQKAWKFLSEKGYPGVLVDIGGDLRVSGCSQKKDFWDIEVKNPVDEGMIDTLHLTDISVCTSGDYERYYTVGGKRFSHIMDPRTGWPADESKSVTVIGQDSMYTDAWATALSVLGEKGLKLLPEGYEAMIVYKKHGRLENVKTSGFYRIGTQVVSKQ